MWLLCAFLALGLPGSGVGWPGVHAEGQDPAAQEPQNPQPAPGQDPEESPPEPVPVEEPEEAEPVPAGETAPPLPAAVPAGADRTMPFVRGRLALRYLYRDATGDTRDQDLLAYATLNLGSPVRDPVTASFYGRAVHDLEGDGSALFGRSLSSIQDSRAGSTEWRLLHGYVAFHRILAGGELRLGRQVLLDTPVWLNLDGGSLAAPVDLLGEDLRLSLYGGIPVHYWEASTDGDSVAGLAADWSPWRGGSVRADAMRIRDRNLFGHPADDLLGLRVGHGDAVFTGSLGWTRLNDRTRDVTAQGSWWSEEQDLRIFGSVRGLLSSQSANTLEFDPFTRVLLPEEPFYEAQFSLAKDLPDFGLHLDGGAYVRILRDEADESEFNREFQRYWLGGTLEDFPLEDVDLSLTGEVWDSGVDTFRNAAAELRVRPHEDVELRAGNAWSLYKFDFFSGVERTGVQSWYGEARVDLTGFLRLRTSVSWERDDLEQYFVASVLAEVSF